MRVRILLGVIASAASLALSTAPVLAGELSERPKVVKIHADWCGTCVRLTPTWEKLQAAHGATTDFVILDVTDRDAVAKSEARAAELGLGDVFRQYRGSTGTIAVLDASGAVVKVFRGEIDAAPYAAAIAAAQDTEQPGA